MTQRLLCTQGDTGGSFLVGLLNDDGTPVDLSAASAVSLQFMAAGSTTVLATLAGTLAAGTVDPWGRQLSGYTTPGSGGLISFAFGPTTLNVPVGVYQGQIQVTYGGLTQDAPQPVYFYVEAP